MTERATEIRRQRAMCLLLVGLLVASLSTIVYQNSSPGDVHAQKAPLLWVDGGIVETDVPPTVVNQRVLVPLGVLARYFGVHAQWNQERKAAYLFLADHRQMALSPGSSQVWIWKQADEQDPYAVTDKARWEPEKTVVLDVAPIAVNGRIMVPLGFVASQLGLTAQWDAESYMVRITSPWYGKYDPAVSVAADLLPSFDIQSTHPDIVALAEEITAGLGSDREKLHAVHDWVATNILYDVEDFATLPIDKPQDALSVLQRRYGVCSGYSSLTAALLRAAGIPARVVHGWARQSNQTWAELLRDLPEDFLAYGNHSWNEALVDGRWVQVDVTWDAGFVYTQSPNDTMFEPSLSRKYLDPEPEIFWDDHSPTYPSATPPDPDHFYFKLGETAQKDIVTLALSVTKTGFWYYPGVGIKDGDDIRALQLIVSGESPEGGKTFLLECRRTGTSWSLVSFTEVPEDYRIPSGGYSYEAPWNR